MEQVNMDSKSNEVFDTLIEFIEKNPDKCRCDAFHFYVGSNYRFWIANGFGQHFSCGGKDGENSIPKELYTEANKKRFESAYKKWLASSYKLPEIVA